MRFFSTLIISCLCFFYLSSFKMADRLFEAEKGEYIVTLQDKNYSLLLVRDIQKNSILLEEVSIPSDDINASTMDWKSWMELGAPGHSSWIQYEIDPTTLKLIECYSFSKKGWLYLEESEHFLSRLLSLTLSKIPSEERKKIGLSPKQEEIDQRPLWNPPFFSKGKKNKIACEAWKSYWPKDDTLLSSCQIIMYFPSKEISSFPLWIEASNGHFSYAIRVIDSGKQLTSFIKSSLPRRPPQFLKAMEKKENSLRLSIKSPAYYKNFSLFAFDLLHLHDRIGPIPFELKQGTSKELAFLDISLSTLESSLVKGHRYKWILIPEYTPASPVESEEFFLWPSLSLR